MNGFKQSEVFFQVKMRFKKSYCKKKNIYFTLLKKNMIQIVQKKLLVKIQKIEFIKIFPINLQQTVYVIVYC